MAAPPGECEAFASTSLYTPLDWLLVRAPLLPAAPRLDVTNSNRRDEPGQERTLDTLVQEDSLLPRDARLRRALAVGSPDLLSALARSCPTSREATNLRRKLRRYLIRMSTRPTPYGLFAGVAMACWGSVTDLTFGSSPPRTRTRPDMQWLITFVRALEARAEIRSELRFFTNPSVLVYAGRAYIAEQAPRTDSHPAATVSMRATGVVRRALMAARHPISHRDLLNELRSRTYGATSEQIAQLITQLWEQTFLLTDLRPPLTTNSPAQYVVDRLADIPAARDDLAQLEALLEAMNGWDRLEAEESIGAYGAITAQAARAHKPNAGETLLQTDMAFVLSGRHVARTVGQEVARAAELLLTLTPFPTGCPYLHRYRQAFVSRYGHEHEVPLLEMLHPSLGLGPPSEDAYGSEENRVATDLRRKALQDLAVSALRQRRLVVQLTEDTVARLRTSTLSPTSVPISLDLSVFVAAASAAAIDAGEFRVIIGPNIGAPAAGRNLGRFADLLGPEAAEALDRAARAEEVHAPHRLRAELVYLPERFRSANVVVRPPVRSHEIVVGTSPGVPSQKVVPLDELVVGVRAGCFYVRWLRNDVEIIACSGHMLNTVNAPAACRFLDEASRDGLAQLSAFDWGPVAGFPFLPRVEMGRIVLALAQWRIETSMRSTELPTRSPNMFGPALAQWREHWDVPQHVYLSVGDKRLLLNLEDPMQGEELRIELARLQEGTSLVLQEALPSHEQAWAAGPGGPLITEFMVPLVLTQSDVAIRQMQSVGSVTARPLDPEKRKRPPGSDWLFVKLYCPSDSEEDVIVGPLRSFCAFARTAGLADDWFFIRYADPDSHLRVRFHGTPETLVRELFPQLCAWATRLISDGLCLRFCFDTYDRETGRYGGDLATEAAETLFGADSRAAVELLELVRHASSDIDRTTLAVLSIDDLLAGLGIREDGRAQWYRSQAEARHVTGLEYRRRNKALRALLGRPTANCQPRPGDGCGLECSRPGATRSRLWLSVLLLSSQPEN